MSIAVYQQAHQPGMHRARLPPKFASFVTKKFLNPYPLVMSLMFVNGLLEIRFCFPLCCGFVVSLVWTMGRDRRVRWKRHKEKKRELPPPPPHLQNFKDFSEKKIRNLN